MTTDNAIHHHPKNLVLDYYHCTLFLPLIGLDEKDFSPMDSLRFSYSPEYNTDMDEAEAQAYLYFSPSLRNILFDFTPSKPVQPLSTIKEWRLNAEDIKGWQLHLGEDRHQADCTQYQRSNIVSARLLQYFNGIYLLVVRVEPEALALLNQDQNQQKKDHFADNRVNTLAELCQQDPDNEIYYQRLAMENWLRFTRHIRLLYPSFAQQKAENKIDPIHLIQGGGTTCAFKEINTRKISIPKKPGEYFSQVMKALLKAFADESPHVDSLLENYDNLYDDRLFVSVAYGIAGDKLPDQSLQRINTLVSHVDRQADSFSTLDGYAYTPEVILAKTAQYAFTLWQGLGGYYSYTDFSNTYLYNGEYFRTITAPDHIPHIYDRMLAQALFYQASLRYYDQQICTDTKALLEKSKLKSMRNQRKDFIEFTNQYWFHQLTTQMQGQEIFSLQQQALGLQQQALGLQQHYDILKDELECTDEYLQTENEKKLNKVADKFTRYGLIFALMALYYTALPIINNVLANGSWLWVSQGWVKYLQIDMGSVEIKGLIILLIMFPLISFVVVMSFKEIIGRVFKWIGNGVLGTRTK